MTPVSKLTSDMSANTNGNRQHRTADNIHSSNQDQYEPQLNPIMISSFNSLIQVEIDKAFFSKNNNKASTTSDTLSHDNTPIPDTHHTRRNHSITAKDANSNKCNRTKIVMKNNVPTHY